MPDPSPPPALRPLLADRTRSMLARFTQVETTSGILLLAAAAIALAWANSPLAASYHALWQAPLSLRLGGHEFSGSLQFWVNDGLMTLFFLVVGMEVRKEMHDGALSVLRQAAMPLVAAAGGVMVPALLFAGIAQGPAQLRGWAVPTATDIAFAVGVLALLGRSIPASVRVFLLTLAIVDDIIAVLIIALFYSGGLTLAGLAVALLGMLVVVMFQRAGVATALPYVIPGAITWAGLMASGVHPALAGVVLGMMTPVVAPMNRDLPAPITRVQQALHPWAAFVVMPLFALANAGVTITATGLADAASLTVMGAVAIALVVGKPVGIFTASWLMVRTGLGTLPAGTNWHGILLIGLLGGIGFTMSIFVAMLAFADEALLSAAKLGVLGGSTMAALAGLAWGWARVREHGASTPSPLP